MTLEALKEKIVLGTVQLGLKYGINNVAGKPTRTAAFRILDKALQSSINTLDTADAYGDALEVIGDYIKGHSQVKFELIGKFIYDDSPLAEKLRKSLNTLGISGLYGYLYHRFSDYSKGYYKDDLLRFKTEGTIERIGVSVYGIDELRMVVDDPDVDLIQTPFNLFDMPPEKRTLFTKAKELGKEIHVRSIFLQGLFFKQPHELTGNLKGFEQPIREFHSILNRFSLNVNQACLNHALHTRVIDRVIIGVDTVSQLEENLAAILGDFSPELSEQLNSIQISDKTLLNPSNWEP